MPPQSQNIFVSNMNVNFYPTCVEIIWKRKVWSRCITNQYTPAHTHTPSTSLAGVFACFLALRPKSTAMVMAGQSVHLTTLLSWTLFHDQYPQKYGTGPG